LKFRLEALQPTHKSFSTVEDEQRKRYEDTRNETYWIDARAAAYHGAVIKIEITVLESQLHYLTTKLVELHKPAS